MKTISLGEISLFLHDLSDKKIILAYRLRGLATDFRLVPWANVIGKILMVYLKLVNINSCDRAIPNSLPVRLTLKRHG